MRKLRIAYVTAYDATDVSNWSGTGYYIAKTLEKHVGDVTYIGDLRPRRFISHDLKRLWYHKVIGESYDATRSALMGKAFAREAERQLRGGGFDLVFSPGSIPIAYLETKIPVAFWTDANFQAMIGYYYMNLSAETIRDGNQMEKAALERSTHAIYSSDWAADGAIAFYKVDPHKVKVVPFGANVSDVPPRNELKRTLKNQELKLLFVGKDWERKGGRIAFETMTGLNQRGVRTSLTVVGCVPPAAFSDPRMEVIPFLDKNKPDDAARLRRLYVEADLFIMPSRKDCSPIVLCEAAAFGLPVLSTDTGGIRTIVPDGVTGLVLPLEAAGPDYVDRVMNLVEGKGAYERLSAAARQRYEDVLNWEAAGKELNRLLG